MTNHRRFSEHKFLLAFVAVLIIIIGLAVFSMQNSTFMPSITAASESRYSLLPTITPTFALLQNEESVTPMPVSSPIFEIIQTPTLEWKPLFPIQDSRGLLTNGDRSEYKIALTFDVCQAEGDLAGFDTEIIRVLNETQTPATFFLGGEWMRDHQVETLELSHNPLFELGNHSWNHEDFSVITSEEIQQEILLTQQYMYELVGYQTNLFRLPYGTYNNEALNLINEQGLYIIQWDDVSGDPDPNIDSQRMTNGVLRNIQPGSIIIMHANGRGWHTAEALPGIIQSIREQGYTLVTVSDLLKLRPYK
jgi:peptidoglycan-N-acetylglucosamine deacetylase